MKYFYDNQDILSVCIIKLTFILVVNILFHRADVAKKRAIQLGVNRREEESSSLKLKSKPLPPLDCTFIPIQITHVSALLRFQN